MSTSLVNLYSYNEGVTAGFVGNVPITFNPAVYDSGVTFDGVDLFTLPQGHLWELLFHLIPTANDIGYTHLWVNSINSAIGTPQSYALAGSNDLRPTEAFAVIDTYLAPLQVRVLQQFGSVDTTSTTYVSIKKVG